MNSSKLFLAAATAVSVFGAATVAHAQSTSTDTGQRQGTMPQSQAQMQQSTTPNQDSTNRSTNDGTMNRSDSTNSSDMSNRTAPMANDSSGMRSQRNSNSTSSERVARADRN